MNKISKIKNLIFIFKHIKKKRIELPKFRTLEVKIMTAESYLILFVSGLDHFLMRFAILSMLLDQILSIGRLALFLVVFGHENGGQASKNRNAY